MTPSDWTQVALAAVVVLAALMAAALLARNRRDRNRVFAVLQAAEAPVTYDDVARATGLGLDRAATGLIGLNQRGLAKWQSTPVARSADRIAFVAAEAGRAHPLPHARQRR